MTLNTFIVSLTLNIFVFILLTVILLKQRRLSKNIATLGEKAAEGNLPYVISESFETINKLSLEVDKLNQYYGKLYRLSNNNLQNIGLVRYNAFEEMGGNLSFSVALLNNQKDGLILTSINGRNEHRLYVKQITAGLPNEQQLTDEEIEAMKQALKSSRELITSTTDKKKRVSVKKNARI